LSTKQVFIFLGAPGVGKGALSSLCVEKLAWKELSTGNECRKHRSEGTKIGQEIDFAIKSGKLVSDDVIIDMVAGWVEENISLTTAVILDGFPRTVPQAQGLIDLLGHEGFGSLRLHIFQLVLSDEKIVERLSSRMMCTNKACQAVYSTMSDEFKPKVEGVCNLCGSKLIRRDDDNPDTIRERLRTYHYHAQALLDFYEKAGYKTKIIDADKPAGQVFENFVSLANVHQ
jgi:adenylate kinase